MKKILLFASAVAMLASCSKEMTEDLAAPVAGTSTIYATYNAEATRTSAQVSGGKFQYVWDASDAIGVFANEEGDATNAVFKNTVQGLSGTFTGSLDMIDAEEYVAYYPYSPTTEYTAEGLNLYILGNQNYNHDAVTAFGSFAQGAAPAIATGVANENSMELTFVPATSYIVVPIKGLGDKVKKLELTVTKKGTSSDEEQPLWGEFKVKPADLEDDEYVTEWAGDASNNTTITLNCGKGVELKKDKETYFWFVVPVGLDLTGKMTVKAYGETAGEEATLERNFADVPATLDKKEIKATQRNVAHVFGPDATSDFFFNPNGSFIITNEYEFLMYADAATNGKTAAYEDIAAYAAMWNEDDLRPAVVVSNLNFGPNFNANPGLLNVDKKLADYWQTLLQAFVDNDRAIETIGAGKDAVKFELTGNVDGKAAEITGLTVKGTAMFDDGYNNGTDSRANVVKKLTFKGSTVDAIGLKSNANFLTYRYYGPLKYAEVTVDKDCKVLVDAEYSAAIVGRAFTDGENEEITYEAPEEGALNYANILYIMKPATGNIVELPEGITCNNLTVHAQADGVMVVVENAAAAKALVAKVNLELEGSGTWFSTVSGYTPATSTAPAKVEVSYWTGGIPASDKYDSTLAAADGIVTAEELAYNIKNITNGTVKNVTLTNNIDLMGDVSVAEGVVTASTEGRNWATVIDNSGQGEVRIDGKNGTANYKISNAWIAPEGSVNYIALFGPLTNVENVDIASVYISDEDATFKSAAYGVAGLAIWTGKIENVSVKDINIVSKNADAVGGVLKSVSASNVNKVTFEGNISATKDKAISGAIAAEFALSAEPNTYVFDYIKAVAVTPAELPVFGQVTVTKPTTSAVSGKYDTEINFYNFSGYAPTNLVAKTTADKNTVVRITTFAGAQGTKGEAQDFTVTK